MGRFENIWEMNNRWWNSDIDIIKNSKWKISIYKKYYNLSVSDIKQYHKKQNWIKINHNKIVLDKSTVLLWKEVKAVTINILKLDESEIYEASDISTKKTVTITNPKYIKWLWTLENYYINKNIQDWIEMKKLIRHSLDIEDAYPIYESFQIAPTNIKVISIKKWIMELLVTDIAQDISKIINTAQIFRF